MGRGITQGSFANQRVCDFILLGRFWNETKLRQVFLSFEVDVILAVPLSDEPHSDTMFWGLEKRGSSRSTLHIGCKWIFWTLFHRPLGMGLKNGGSTNGHYQFLLKYEFLLGKWHEIF